MRLGPKLGLNFGTLRVLTGFFRRLADMKKLAYFLE